MKRGADSQTTTYSYNDTTFQVSVTASKDQYASGDGRLVTAQNYDGLGRQVQSSSGSSNPVVSTTSYDGFGRVSSRCNPQASGAANDTDGCEYYTYDSLGRTNGITRADGSSVTITYTGNAAATKDERQTTSSTVATDALGRMQSVTDDLSYPTSYTFDALDDLLTVTQGQQTRNYTYDGLKRLLTVTQPETTQITYTYDNNGNLIQKKQSGVLGSTITTTLGYDAINRLVSKTYAGVSTPPATFCFDGRKYDSTTGSCDISTTQPTLGQYMSLTGTGTGTANNLVASTALSYDAVGRVSTNSETIPNGPGSPYILSYAYNLDDSVQSVKYASGRLATNCYDALGRMVWVSSTKQFSDCQGQLTAGFPTSASGYYGVVQSFFPAGQVKQLALGNGLTETWDFNNRQQPLSVQLSSANVDCPGSGLAILSLAYAYNAGHNNGNVQSQTINSVTTGCTQRSLFQSYSYDALNRLTLAQEPGWSEGYTYDQYGNIQVVPSQTTGTGPAQMPSSSVQIDVGTNRVIKSTPTQPTNDVHYDDSGNQTAFPGFVTQAVYDAENRLTSFTRPDGAQITFTYDADGRRVTKTMGGIITYYVYDAAGQLTAEYGGSGSGASGTVYQTEDPLGNTRAVTDSSGKIVSRSDYMPFGENIIGSSTYNRAGLIGYGPPQGTELAFTGKERDAETGLDYFGARYFSGAQGRFTSPDKPFAGQNPANPQSWNLYSYGLNNPLRYIDPTGHDPEEADPADNGNDCGKNMKDCGPQIRALPQTTLGQTQDRAVGALKGVGNTILDLAQMMGAPQANVDQIKDFFNLEPTSQNQKFGAELGGILGMLLPGGEAEKAGEVLEAASSAKAGLNLTKSLASEQQMSEILSGAGQIIAGPGARTALRDAPRLSVEYGGAAGDWVKVASKNFKAADGTSFEIHAYKNMTTGKIVEFKTKFQ